MYREYQVKRNRRTVFGDRSAGLLGSARRVYGPGSGPEWRWAVARAGAHTLVVPFNSVESAALRRVASWIAQDPAFEVAFPARFRECRAFLRVRFVRPISREEFSSLHVRSGVMQLREAGDVAVVVRADLAHSRE